MAIGFALVYRVMRDAPPPALAQAVVLPPGAEVISALVSEGAINVTYRIGDTTSLTLFDRETGEPTRSVVLGQ
ncbi:MAG: hypothetical protein JWP99_1184 [Devosia sp.]|nr:hypothetical protein [Devosia sp.]